MNNMGDEVSQIKATIETLKQSLHQLEDRLKRLEANGQADNGRRAVESEPAPPQATQLGSAAVSPRVPAPSSGLPGDPHGTGGAVPMAATRVVMHQIVMPALTDSLGICFGGEVLSWIDLCAGMSAKTLARGPCVTATVDAVHFLQPCRLGSVVIIAAMVNRTFNTSMEVGVRVEAEDMRTGVRVHCCSAYLTFVSVKPGHGHTQPPRPSPSAYAIRSPTSTGGAEAAGGAPAPLPRVAPGGNEQARIHEEAEARRQERLAERTRARVDPGLAAARERCRLRPITHRDGGPTLPPSIITPNRSAHFSLGVGPATAPHMRWPHAYGAAASTSGPGRSQVTASGGTSGAGGSTGGGGTGGGTEGGGTGAGTVLSPAGRVGSADELAAEAVARVGELLTNLCAPDADANLSTNGNSSGPASDPLPPARSAAAGGTDAAHLSPSNGPPVAASQEAAAPVLQLPPANAQAPAAQAGVPRSQTPLSRHCVAPGLTEAYMTQQVMPQHANSIAITFGGQVMSWMEQCAYISASRLRAPHILTAAMDSVTFVRATKVGHILYVTSQVTAIFGSSLEVMVSIHGEDPAEGRLFHCADAYVTLVAVAGAGDDAPGAPVQLPFQLQPAKEEELMRYQGAQQRRQQRLRMRSQLVQAAHARSSLDGSLPTPLPPTS